MEELWKDLHQSENNNPRISRGFFEEMLGRPQVSSQGDQNEFKATNNHNNVDYNNDEEEEDDDKNGIFKKELLMSSVISTPGFMSSLNSPFEALATNTVVANSTNSPASSLLNTSCFPIITNNNTNNNNNTNKRPLSEISHYDVIEGETGVDRRHKRMIKNRESAARSRARRQAYTSQLEKEREELEQENAMLKKQQKELMLSTPAQVPKKRTHNRSQSTSF